MDSSMMADPGAAPTDSTGADASEAQAQDQGEESGEPSSVFLPETALGGRKVKPGDTLSLTVREVDPETGDVQADVTQGDADDQPPAPGDVNSDFDAAMPPEQAAS